MPFVSSSKPPPKAPDTALWFVFHDQRLLIKNKDEDYFIPQSQDLEALNMAPIQRLYIGSLDNQPCYAAELSDATLSSDAFAFRGLRALFERLEEDVIQAAGLANQLVCWNQKHRYCGRCGNPTKDKADERATICPRCGSIYYPRLSPAVIVAVLKDNQILLANSQRFPAKFYSVLAGFVEPGETLEECVNREVREEVGITVKNIRYFGSQPWPFPDSLMIAFTADYAGGDIRIDNTEIVDAGWFFADGLPPIPPKISIARHLIDWFSENKKG
ncbi:MAG: NAD(+) diphosphatase [Pseudomonadota bacterium]